MTTCNDSEVAFYIRDLVMFRNAIIISWLHAVRRLCRAMFQSFVLRK